MSILTVTITIDVDPDVWAYEYGLESDEIQEDLVNHLPGLLDEVVKGKAELLGTFTIRSTTGELDGHRDDNSRCRRCYPEGLGHETDAHEARPEG